MINTKILKGKLLLAEPFMVDSNFKRAVVLVCEHAADGSLGFILNKSLDMKINELIADFPEIESMVYYGGPVQTDTIHYIHDKGDILNGSQEISDGIFWGGDFEQLKLLIDSELIQPHNIRFFVGYSGWSPLQLKEEMKMGSWVLGDLDANYVFNFKIDDLWQQAMGHKGDAFSIIAQMPDNITWN